jgi:hypothetical protein
VHFDEYSFVSSKIQHPDNGDTLPIPDMLISLPVERTGMPSTILLTLILRTSVAEYKHSAIGTRAGHVS